MTSFENQPWKQSCLQVYTGDGKGKTTAALGLALRAAGRGMKVFIGQFMKGSEYGELEGVKMLRGLVELEQFGSPECIPLRDEPDPAEQKPSVFRLYQNYPNPFNFLTTITYDVPKQARVTIEIYDMLGRKTATLVDKTKKKGHYHVIWNAKELASGVYFCRFQAGDYCAVKKLLFLK